MTIAAGFVCNDGAVICADSQHTGSTAKFDDNKIIEISKKDGARLVVTGAGATDYLRMAADLLEEGFQECKSTFTDIRKLIKGVILEVYRDHITPFWPPGDPNTPQVLLIVAARIPSGKVRLWKVSETSVSMCRMSVFVGIGSETANGLATWLYDGVDDWSVTQVLAKEILTETKRTVRDCGGETHVCTIPEGKEHIHTTIIRPDLEGEFFDGINRHLGDALICAIDKRIQDSTFKSRVGILVKHLQRLRDRAKALPRGDEAELMFSMVRRSIPSPEQPEP